MESVHAGYDLEIGIRMENKAGFLSYGNVLYKSPTGTHDDVKKQHDRIGALRRPSSS